MSVVVNVVSAQEVDRGHKGRKMSHQVTITRTTTTTTASGIFVNTDYMKSGPGLLKFAELILGAVCVGLVGHYIAQDNIIRPTTEPHFYFLLAAFACLVGTFCLWLAGILSVATGSIVSKTFYEVVFHFIAFLLYLSASLNLIIQLNNRKEKSYYKPLHYDAFLAASIIGLVNSALYLLSVIFAWRSYKLV